jgi:hypothetical protein
VQFVLEKVASGHQGERAFIYVPFMVAALYLLNIFLLLRGRDQKKPSSDSNLIASAAFRLDNKRHGG